MGKIKKTVNQVIKPHTPLHNALKNVLSRVGVTRKQLFSDSDYRRWIKTHEMSDTSKSVQYSNIVISVVTSFWNTPQRYLEEYIESFEAQTQATGWELIMVDVSTDERCSQAILDISKRHSNFSYLKAPNIDIATNTNRGISAARGEYIAFIDHDDIVAKNAMKEILEEIESNHPVIIYSDEDKIDDRAKVRHSPYFKPEWSPHLFLFTNYLNHLTVIKKNAINDVGNLRPEFNGSQDYDLLLRVVRNIDNKQIRHIPRVLYHWREAVGSTAVSHSNKNYAYTAGKRALEDYLAACHTDGKVYHVKDAPGFYREEFQPPNHAKVGVIFSEDAVSISEEIRELTHSVFDVDYKAKDASLYDYVVYINTPAIPASEKWIDFLIGVLYQLPETKSVSPQILTKDARFIVNAGFVKSGALESFAMYNNMRINDHTPTGGVHFVRDVDEPLREVFVERGTQQANTHGYHVLWSHVAFRQV